MARNKLSFVHQHDDIYKALGITEQDIKNAWTNVIEPIIDSTKGSWSKKLEAVWNSELSDELVIYSLFKFGCAKMEQSKVRAEMHMIKIDKDGLHKLKSSDMTNEDKNDLKNAIDEIRRNLGK